MRAGVVAALALAVALAGCSGSPPASPPAAPPGAAPGPAHTGPNPVVEFDTSMGKFRAELFHDKVPVTAGNFLNLTQQKYFDGNRFHRVIANFMIQDGDPLSKDPAQKDRWGTGGPDYTIPDEFRPDLKHDAAGVLSMANRGPNTGSSQFFVTLAATSWLDAYDANGQKKACGQPRVSCHAVFGKVTSGLDVVDAIGKVPTDDRDRPVQDVLIRSVTVVTG